MTIEKEALSLKEKRSEKIKVKMLKINPNPGFKNSCSITFISLASFER